MLVHINRSTCFMTIVSGHNKQKRAVVHNWNNSVGTIFKDNPHHRLLSRAKILADENNINYKLIGVHDASDVAEHKEDILALCQRGEAKHARQEYTRLCEFVIARMASAGCDSDTRFRMAVHVANAQIAVEGVERAEEGFETCS